MSKEGETYISPLSGRYASEAELEAKDQVLRQKAAFDKEVSRDRDELRSREKSLDKRQELIERLDDRRHRRQ